MNKAQKEVVQASLDSEKAVLKELEKQYQIALKEIDEKIKVLNDTGIYMLFGDEIDRQNAQSKIYQMQYQRALRDQISGILDKLHSDEFTSIQQYLDSCYSTGFVGTMYGIANDGIPIVVPINQDAMIKAIQLDSKLSEPLYDSLGVDISSLKKTIRSEVSRGIASGLSYNDIARNIENVSAPGLKRAKTIARTEGHRVQESASQDARIAAKKKGADVVKQWDASLDGKTRDTHRRLDGQIKEIDEPFEMDGKKAMYPGEFGDPAEDCNCRCTALTRARAALDEDELKTLKDRAAYFGLDNTESFKDFRKKYLTAVENAEKDAIIEFTKASTIEEAGEFARDVLGVGQTTAYSLGMNVDVANGLNEAIFEISNTFGSLTEYGYLEDVQIHPSKDNSYAAYMESTRTLFLNQAVKKKSALKVMAETASLQFEHGAWSTPDAMHSVYHELGHAAQHMLLDSDAKKRNAINVFFNKTFSDVFGEEFTWVRDKNVAMQMSEKVKEVSFSYYGLKNAGEMVAESVAQYFLSPEPSDIAKTVVKILNGVE